MKKKTHSLSCYLKQELEARQWTLHDLADHTQIPYYTLKEICNDERKIDLFHAHILGKVMNVPSELVINLLSEGE